MFPAGMKRNGMQASCLIDILWTCPRRLLMDIGQCVTNHYLVNSFRRAYNGATSRFDLVFDFRELDDADMILENVCPKIIPQKNCE